MILGLVSYRCEDTPCNYISFNLRESVLDGIEPRRVSRREVFKAKLIFYAQAVYYFVVIDLYPIRMV